MSVLDRLRASRAAAPSPESDDGREPATLKDVAQAIAAASAAPDAEIADAPQEESSAAPAAQEEDFAEPPLRADAQGWRESIVQSLNETREELKEAHAKVARLRRRLSEFDKTRIERRGKILANLTRAETLLSEIRDAWR